MNAFDAERAAHYDHDVRIGIPGYDGMHLLAVALLREQLIANARVLVVGAGTGEELVRLAACDPTWRFTAVEPSPAMVEWLRARLTEHGIVDRVQVHAGDVRELAADLPPHDAAVVLLVLHFLPDDGAKAALLEELARRMSPGAPLLHADLHGAPGTNEFRTLLDGWKTAMVLGGFSRADVEKGFATITADVAFVPESRLHELWTGAGFERPLRFFASHLVGAWQLERTST